jgi:hypothetical protein
VGGLPIEETLAGLAPALAMAGLFIGRVRCRLTRGGPKHERREA